MNRRITSMLFLCAVLRAGNASQPLFFSKQVYPLLEEANCRGCHTRDGVASATRVSFPDAGAAADVVEAFGRSLSAVVDRQNPTRSLLLLKPTNQVSHGGGERLRPGSSGEQMLKAWVMHLVTLPIDSRTSANSSRKETNAVTRRLTHSQYDRTVRDLLGDDIHPSRQFPAEDFIDGYRNQIAGQNVSPLLVEAYAAAAEKLAANAFRFGDSRGLIPCNPQSYSDRKCAGEFVRRFGLHAYRRPLTADEQTTFVDLLLKEAGTARQFTAGARIVIEVMLQSPNFLFRVERSSGPLNSYEMASRLSYALWDTMPDEALFDLAARGKLATAEEVEAQARRMLKNEKSRDAVDEFTAQWLRFDRLYGSLKDRRVFPMFSPSLLEAMGEESRRLIQHVVWENRPFTELLTAPYSFLNADLAGLYGLPVPSAPFAKMMYPPDSERAGILGHGTFLAQTGKPEETSPTERGLFVRERLLCQAVPPPPPGLNATLPAFVSGSKPMTNRDRMTKLHLTKSTCAGCHVLIDPIGFGLERFDTLGQWHQKQTVTIFPTKDQRYDVEVEKHELDLDTSAAIRGIPGSEFSSAKKLGSILAEDPTCQKCIVRQWFRFTFGRRDTEADSADVDRVFYAFRQSGFRFQELMVALTKSDVFRGVRPSAAGTAAVKDVR